MHYQLAISEEAREQLRALPKDRRRQIGSRLAALQEDLSGDVRKLATARNKYRLRVGDYRVLFRLEGNTIEVYQVADRKNAYE